MVVGNDNAGSRAPRPGERERCLAHPDGASGVPAPSLTEHNERVRIRPADVTDAVAVFTLLDQATGGAAPRRSAFDHNYEQVIAAMTYDGTDFVVADRDGEVIGYALAARVLSLSANGPVSQLLELVVGAAHRGRGVGALLVDAIIRRARNAGAVEVTVAARGARGYFERRGFTETATCLTLPLL